MSKCKTCGNELMSGTQTEIMNRIIKQYQVMADEAKKLNRQLQAVISELKTQIEIKDRWLVKAEADFLLNDNKTIKLQARIATLEGEAKNLKEFARQVIKDTCWNQLDDFDGCEVQDLAENLGLIEPCIVTEEDVDDEFDDYEVGDTIYKFSEALKGGE